MMTIVVANEIAATLLPDAKIWIRKSVSKLDTEIQQTVAACMLDLKNAGIVNFRAEDPLLQQAAKLYLKAQFGFDEKSEKWEQAYEHLKAALSLSYDYTLPWQEDTDG
ncbi:MAG: DNA-packaging protein [Oscillospiraceae bacterium]|nr:DNA-packaging protein [Oscillospiraceae bacterium]MBR2422020.1 DNA-packaging protein [Oscillospiraceae bacterium]